ncbi:MAG: T9SS C-terminal target domain-containing protein [Chitinophagaceae bacterium]|nr:MAG: T9SS C-terminal target domain-containing protein [Chitinophagaceae bacterium]
MNIVYTFLLAFLFKMFFAGSLLAQFVKNERYVDFNPIHTCNATADIDAIINDIEFNSKALRKEGGNLKSLRAGSQEILFSWPLRAANHFHENSYYGITNFVDHDLNYPNQVLDYYCGERTYDTNTGNHGGTDIAVYPQRWSMMDNDMVEIVAAATGVIVFKRDGEYDRNCNFSSDSLSNAIILEHANGMRSMYYHMKKNSVTEKNIGDLVVEGEYLGIVGSSGTSSGPHLHFEIRDSLNQILDPFEGPCNPSVQNSLWKSQKPYYNYGLLTANIQSQFQENSSDCKIDHQFFLKNHFQQGEQLFLHVFGRTTQEGDSIHYFLYRPDGTEYWNHLRIRDTGYANLFWAGRSRTIQSNEQDGTWKYRVIAAGDTIDKYFCVGSVSSVTSVLNYDIQSNGKEVHFESLSENAFTYLWQFGDGYESVQMNPTHQYDEFGIFEVCLTVTNGCDSSTFCEYIDLLPVSNVTMATFNKPIIYPNPANSNITVRFNDPGIEIHKVYILNLLGQKVEAHSNNLPGNTFMLTNMVNQKGMYILKIDLGNKNVYSRIVID